MKLTEAKSSESVFGSVLSVGFICLKLAGIIDWSWWMVLAPVWIPMVLVVIVLGIVGAATTIKGAK